MFKAPDIGGSQAQQAITAFQQVARRSGEIGQPIQVTVYRGANLAEIQVPLTGTGTDATSRHALTTLHDTIVPATRWSRSSSTAGVRP